MSSVGNTYFSRDFGQTFEVSNDSTYLDRSKAPVPTSVTFSENGSTVHAVLTFNRAIDESNFSLGSFVSRLCFLDGGGNGTHTSSGSATLVDDYTLQVEMALSTAGDLGGDIFIYDGTDNNIVGTNGVEVEPFEIKHVNAYPNPQSAIVNVDGPDIEVIITFDKDLDTSLEISNNNVVLNYQDFLYTFTSYTYPDQYKTRMTFTKDVAGSGSTFTYSQSSLPYLNATNGLLVRPFSFNIDGTSESVTIINV